MRILLLSLLLCGLAACITTERDLSGAAAAKRNLSTNVEGWTTDFMRRRLLVADEIRVSGPQGLRAHLATRFDPQSVQRSEKATPEGYRMSFRPQGDLEVACYLDKLEAHAVRGLVVLERPGPVDVLVEAVGDVYLADLESGEEQRVPSLRLTGRIQR